MYASVLLMIIIVSACFTHDGNITFLRCSFSAWEFGLGEIMYFSNPSITSRMWHKGNFKMRYSWFLIHSFASPNPVALQRLKNSNCPAIST